MGSIIYEIAGITVDIEDRLLAHLRLVIVSKLRRGESFAFTTSHDVQRGSGRTTFWLNQATPLVFRFTGHEIPALNREWLTLLTQEAQQPDGLRPLPEPKPQLPAANA